MRLSKDPQVRLLEVMGTILEYTGEDIPLETLGKMTQQILMEYGYCEKHGLLDEQANKPSINASFDKLVKNFSKRIRKKYKNASKN